MIIGRGLEWIRADIAINKTYKNERHRWSLSRIRGKYRHFCILDLILRKEVSDVGDDEVPKTCFY